MAGTPQSDDKPEVMEGIEVEPGGVLATISKTEINQQIATAHKYPRSIQKFQRDLMAYVTADQETAAGMYYKLPRRSQGRTINIEGPSVRLAEAAASCWGNIHCGARVAAIEDEQLVGQAVVWDLEKNVRIAWEVRRRIIDRNGNRYGDDMIQTTGNAATAIAFRNAVFKVVPGALIKKAYNEAKQVSLGKGLTMEQRRANAFKAFAQIGAKEKDVLRVLKRRGVEDITVDDLIDLQGMLTAIKDGDTTWNDIMSQIPKTDEEINAHLKTGLDDIADGLADGKENADPLLTADEAKEVRLQVAAMDLDAESEAVVLREAGVKSYKELRMSQLPAVIAALQKAAEAR